MRTPDQIKDWRYAHAFCRTSPCERCRSEGEKDAPAEPSMDESRAVIVAVIRKRHQPVPFPRISPQRITCSTCMHDVTDELDDRRVAVHDRWPCDAAILLEELDKALRNDAAR